MSVVAVGLVYRVPILFEISIKEYRRGNSTLFFALSKSQLRSHPTYQTLYKTYAYAIFNFALPFSIMIILNIFFVLSFAFYNLQ